MVTVTAMQIRERPRRGMSNSLLPLVPVSKAQCFMAYFNLPRIPTPILSLTGYDCSAVLSLSVAEIGSLQPAYISTITTAPPHDQCLPVTWFSPTLNTRTYLDCTSKTSAQSRAASQGHSETSFTYSGLTRYKCIMYAKPLPRPPTVVPPCPGSPGTATLVQ
ncbi:hypothetical protein BaRGS_00002544 [Batillaria attramentaria]|uniref:Uncharacterized protein n=1 Tax=Batillaria attramentaria TaxID=370345 RepID=A0ABD0M407_9CAEN